MDIVFVLDNSGSVSEIVSGTGKTGWELTQAFVEDVVARVNIGSTDTRVGLLSYSNDVDHHWYLTTYTEASRLLKALHNIQSGSGSTNTAAALTAALIQLNRARANVETLVIVVSDDEASSVFDSVDEAASQLARAADKVIAIGASSDISLDTLKIIASPEVEEETYFQRTSYDSLSDIPSVIIEACGELTYMSRRKNEIR